MSDYSVEDIFRAKRIVRNSGYTVELPKDEVEQARNIAIAAGYNVRKADEPAPAAKPAEAPAPVVTPKTKPAAAPAPAEEQPKKTAFDYSMDIASRYL